MYERIDIVLGTRTQPGIVIGPEQHVTQVRPSKDPNTPGRMVNIPTTIAKVISLRDTNPALGPVRTYLAITDENRRFTFPREEPVVGLDYDENGDPIPVKTLIERAKADLIAYQQQRQAAAQAAAPELDMDELDALTTPAEDHA